MEKLPSWIKNEEDRIIFLGKFLVILKQKSNTIKAEREDEASQRNSKVKTILSSVRERTSGLKGRA